MTESNIDELAKAEASLHFNKEFSRDSWQACVSCFKAGYQAKQSPAAAKEGTINVKLP